MEEEISEESKEIMGRMLIVEQMKRIKTKEIKMELWINRLRDFNNQKKIKRNKL